MKNMIFTPIPNSINYSWNTGSIMLTLLLTQIISGFIVSLFYNSSIDLAFSSVDQLNRYVNYGWLFRLIHVNGASLYFLILYMHIFRGFLYKSWKLKMVWSIGIIIFILSMMTAFLGYILPWGQMSFWAATVITNLFTSIPMIGEKLVITMWGGFAVSAPTLNRFFSLHFIIPFIILFMVMIHLIFLHLTGSNNPLGISLNKDKISFYPYFYFKDIITSVLIMTMILFLVLFTPFISMDADNFMMANPMSTPEHIQPEWYFLFAYSILRAIPNKGGGVICMMMSIMILFTKIMEKNKNSFNMSIMHKIKINLLAISFSMLTYLGAMPAEPPFTNLMQLFSFMYFIVILMI